MIPRSKQRLVITVSLLALAATALLSGGAAADKSFTLAMEDRPRHAWDKAFNKLVAEPFEAVRCAADSDLELPAGEGCVDAGDLEICCQTWTLNLRCNQGKWEQKSIEGASCQKRPAKKD